MVHEVLYLGSARRSNRQSRNDECRGKCCTLVLDSDSRLQELDMKPAWRKEFFFFKTSTFYLTSAKTQNPRLQLVLQARDMEPWGFDCFPSPQIFEKKQPNKKVNDLETSYNMHLS